MCTRRMGFLTSIWFWREKIRMKNYDDFIKLYKDADDEKKFKLLDAMYGNVDLKSILDTF